MTSPRGTSPSHPVGPHPHTPWDPTLTPHGTQSSHTVEPHPTSHGTPPSHTIGPTLAPGAPTFAPHGTPSALTLTSPHGTPPSHPAVARSDTALKRKRETLDLRISWVSLWFKGLRQCIRDITYALWHTAHGFRTHGASVLTLSTGPRSVRGMQTYARPASRACSGSWCTACAARRASRGYADVAWIPANRNTRCS